MPAALQKLPWSWNAPVLEKAVAHLMQGWRPGLGALDLSDRLVVVPTMEAGRRLKEALARAADEHGSGAVVPWVWTPETVLSPPLREGAVASRLQCRMAWQKVLQNVPLSALESLFPRPPEEVGWTWELEMAELLSELKSLLGAGGLTFADVAEKIEADAARWKDLARLEAAFLKELETAGLEEPQAAKRAVAHEPLIPEGVHSVLVLPSPDLTPLLTTWLQSCASRGTQVMVCVHAPPQMTGWFDDAGRPLPGFWGEQADHQVPLTEEHIHVCHDAAAQAAAVLGLIRQAAPKGRVAVGIGDPETGTVLIEKLRVEGVRVFEPGGVPPMQTGLWHVLQQMQALLGGGSWRAFASLLRVPEVRQGLAGAGDESTVDSDADELETRPSAAVKPSGLRLLEEADDFAARHLPVTLEHGLELLDSARSPLLARAMKGMQALLSRMRSLPLADAAREMLICFHGAREFVPNKRLDHLLQGLADAWLLACAEVQEELPRFGLSAGPGEQLALSLQMIQDRSLGEPRGEVDLVLQGWLELLWEPAPHLVVAGVNEEHIPGILTAHPFLPDSTREALGLPCQASRFARDAYLLRALAEMRAGPSGSLHLTCGQWGERGDALRPSRLLLLCPDHRLPDRVEHLFPKEDGAVHAAEPPRTLLWRLRPRITAPVVETISPTRLRSYLNCPFRDYCSNELGMAAVDASRRELDAMGFGTLAHHAFHQLALDASVKDSDSEKEIAEFLVESARAEMHRLHGHRPAPLISIQFEALVQNLRHAAEIEAAQRADGWRIYAAEMKIGSAGGREALRIEGAVLKGKIDRVDRHEKTGRLRLIDFKTSNKARNPRDAHVEKIGPRRRISDADLWKTFELEGETWLWQDLQLPLYAAAMRQQGLRVDEAGYFCLPKSVQDTAILTWENFDDAWEGQALACAAEIVRRLREGLFWPPAEKAFEQDYEGLFLGDILAAVEPL